MRVRSLLAIPTAYLFQRETKRPRFDWEEAEATPAATTTTTDATSVPATAPAPESSAPQNQVNNSSSGDNSAAVAVGRNTRRSNRVLRSNGLSGVTDANSDKENNSNSNSDGHNHYFANDDDEEEDFADSFSELTVSEKTKHDDEHMGTNVGVKTARKSQQRKRKHSESEMITDSDSIRVPFQSPSNTANSAAAAAAATAQPSTSVNISLSSLRKQSRTATANTSTATATITTTAIFNSTTSAANNNNNNNNTSSTEGAYSSSSSTSPSSSATQQQQQQQQPKPVVTQHHHHHHPKSMKPTEWKKWLADYLELVKEVKASQPPPPPPRQPTAFCRWTACEWSGFHVDDLEEHLQEVHIDVQPFFDERGRVMKWAKPHSGVQGKVQGKNTGKITAADNQPSTSTAATPHAKHSSSSSSSKTVCRRSQRSTRTCSVVTETAREEFVCLWADCPVYGKPYDTREGLGKHIRRLHFQKKVVRVATSKKSASSFSSANSFFSSSSSTVGPIDLPYRCTITAKKEDKIGEQTCPMRFRTGAALQKHLKEDHPNGSILEIYRKLPFFALNPPNARPRVNQPLNSFSDQAGNEVVEAARATIMKATGVTKAFREVKMMEVRQKGPNGSSQKTLICPPKGAKNEDLKTMFVFDERLFNYNRPINPTYPLSQLVPYAKHSSNSSGNLNGKQSQDYNKVTKDNNISSNNNNTKKKKKVKVGESGNDLSNDKIGKDNDKTINKSRKRKASSS